MITPSFGPRGTRSELMASVGVRANVIAFGSSTTPPVQLFALATGFLFLRNITAFCARPGELEMWSLNERNQPQRRLAILSQPAVELRRRTARFDRIDVNGARYYVSGQQDEVDSIIRLSASPTA